MLTLKGIVKTVLFALLLLFFILPAFSQKNSIRGIVTDTAEKKDLHYCIVALIDKQDSTLFRSVRSDESGGFELTGIPAGNYTLLISYPKMADYLKDITISATSKIDLGKIVMISKADLLAEVVVTAGVPIRMRGDTLEYTADSFAVRPGANVEELLKRLPGIQVEKNGKIFAQGKQVQKVLVDGDEFFSDDPGLATRYLEANAIDKVQVFDQKSEQSQFNGIDDGNRTKTINLKLKNDKKNGYFGKLSTGADGTNYYQHEAMGAIFDGPLKMALFGLSFRTGGQDIFSNELGNYVGQDYELIDDGTGTMGISYNGNDAGLSYSASGIPSVMEGGGHYSNKWNNNRQKLQSNYRVNQVNSSSWSNGNSISVLPDGTGFNNNNTNTNASYSYAQKAGGSFALPLDSFITVKLSVNGSMSNNNSHSNSQSDSRNEKGILVNNGIQGGSSAGESRQFGTNLSYQQKFRKQGRTLSLLVQQELNNNDHDNYNYSDISYYNPSSGVFTNSDTLNQLQRTGNSFESYAAKAVYTDKLSKNLHISAEYGWKTAVSGNVFNTFNNQNGKYQERVDSLSNDYRFTANTHITGALLSWNNKSTTITAGSKVYLTQFRQANNDLKEETKRNFINLAPQLTINLRLNQSEFLFLQYSGQTFQPSVEQLQPLHRSSSSQYVQIGNPDLKPGFRSTTSFNFYKYNFINSSSLVANASLTTTSNVIGRLTSVDAQNRTISQYINITGIPNIYGSIRYNWQYKKIKLKPSASVDFGINGTYSIQNNVKLKNESRYVNGGFSLEHEWPNKITTVYNGSINYEVGKSDISTIKTNIVIRHSHTITTSIYLSSKTDLGSDCVFSFQPKNSSFNTSFNTVRWNAYLQRRLLKNDKGMVKLAVNDILNSNTGYYRSVYGNNISESDRLVVKRYFLLTLTWNFSKSGK